eukprot:TRINITY_DN6331_c0_g1_i1.p3 TRINITY_DN6331_c0_g1~~TRINITY_DN6331_c0_g1_i1.p3  ORF type:complete len:119 (+),score=12.73 TRINITY_DN6331_c0_g1_i1:727-1083(+)
MTGKEGTFHSSKVIEYGTKMIGGVSPKKNAETNHLSVSIFKNCQEPKKDTGCNASVIQVPPPFAAKTIMEAMEAEIELVVFVTEGIQQLDIVKVKTHNKTRFIGPNCPGIIKPNKGYI